MRYKKLTADCDDTLMEKVVRAVKIERRTLANFIRLACEERANKIIGEDDDEKDI